MSGKYEKIQMAAADNNNNVHRSEQTFSSSENLKTITHQTPSKLLKDSTQDSEEELPSGRAHGSPI
ncbi:MAG: hypothetical protein AAF243_01285 [Cyanobacteria bacterium P01_A01_bin.137]